MFDVLLVSWFDYLPHRIHGIACLHKVIIDIFHFSHGCDRLAFNWIFDFHILVKFRYLLIRFFLKLCKGDDFWSFYTVAQRGTIIRDDLLLIIYRILILILELPLKVDCLNHICREFLLLHIYVSYARCKLLVLSFLVV